MQTRHCLDLISFKMDLNCKNKFQTNVEIPKQLGKRKKTYVHKEGELSGVVD